MAIDKELFYASHGLKYPVVARPYTDDMEVKEVVFTKADMVDVLNRIRAEIEEKFGDYDICEWFEDYDYEENDISEYRSVGDVSDILAIIDKYKAESEVGNESI